MKKLILLLLLSPIAQAATICGQYDAVQLGDYRINNNVWNDVAGTNCLTYTTPSPNFTVSTSNHNKPLNGPPAVYSFVQRGCHWGVCTANNPMPKQVSAITAAWGTWTTTAATGAFNSSFDIWVNTTPTAAGQPDALELMIWINKVGAIQPIGSLVSANVSIAGQTWDVWYNASPKVLTYVKTNPFLAVSNLNLKSFFTDAANRKKLNSAWYLIAVEAGFEIWNGGLNLSSSDFSVTVQ